METFTRLAFLLVGLLPLVACGGGGDSGSDGDVRYDADATDSGADADADATPDVVPDGTPDVDPDATPDVVPDGTGEDGADAPDGEVGPARCGPFPGGTCGTGEVCDIRSCGLGAGGTCVPRPEGCDGEWDPVCGCDGHTYSNDCARLAAGVALSHAGECGTTSVCGGWAGAACPSLDQVCDIRDCARDAEGACVTRPTTCPDVYEPVCGCNGVTYGNDCLRLVAEQPLNYAGECGTVATCGGWGGIPCGDTEVCDIHGCWPDASGTCVPRPGVCPDYYRPVCGCDGNTYDNDCLRLSAGIALDHDGECATTSCTPECSGSGSTSGWTDPCTGMTICRVRCTGCTATCDFVGTRSEGWYAHCAGSIGGGCGMPGSPTLITWADCG